MGTSLVYLHDKNIHDMLINLQIDDVLSMLGVDVGWVGLAVIDGMVRIFEGWMEVGGIGGIGVFVIFGGVGLRCRNLMDSFDVVMTEFIYYTSKL